MAEVPVRKTPWTLDELLTSYQRAWTAKFGVPLGAAGTCILAAQSTLECGPLGKIGCFGCNPSNIMALGNYAGDYHVLRLAPECGDPNALPADAILPTSVTISCKPGQVAYIPKGGSRFRSYKSFDEGCADKIAVLHAIWPLACDVLYSARDSSDVLAFVNAILRPRYFSASEITYAKNVASIMDGILASVAPAFWAAFDPAAVVDVPTPTLLSEKPYEEVTLMGFLSTLADDTPDTA